MTDQHRSNGIAYRADIDGLRAVAIVPVVLYHGGIAPFTGGYVGVDVFFVISGYLITSFILGQIDHREFSLTNFYLRRIRRIFPALFVMMAFCAATGSFLLTPNDYRRLGESIFATVVFASNVLFWLQSGYFAAPLEARPLLHTWSLGVEEGAVALCVGIRWAQSPAAQGYRFRRRGQLVDQWAWSRAFASHRPCAC
jgi:peptidoglycan/LPS O-acetylase OafA/YrhL